MLHFQTHRQSDFPAGPWMTRTRVALQNFLRSHLFILTYIVILVQLSISRSSVKQFDRHFIHRRSRLITIEDN